MLVVRLCLSSILRRQDNTLPVAGARPLETGEQAPDHLSGRCPHVAARLEQVAKTINADVIASAAMLPRLALPEDVDVLDRGEHMVNGVAKPLQVYSLARGEPSEKHLPRALSGEKVASALR